MPEIVNLREARKRRARDEAARQAEQNRARHGRTAAQKAADGRDAAARKSLLDGVRRDQPKSDRSEESS